MPEPHRSHFEPEPQMEISADYTDYVDYGLRQCSALGGRNVSCREACFRFHRTYLSSERNPRKSACICSSLVSPRSWILASSS